MRLLSTLFLLFGVLSLCAQSNNTPANWIGVNNLFYKNKNVEFEPDPLSIDSTLFIHGEELDQQFSIGLFFRKVNKNSNYQQFDLCELNWSKYKVYREVRSSVLGHPITDHPINGVELKDFNLLLGYQRGKLFPISQKLSGDVGLRGVAWYERNHIRPVSNVVVPRRNTSVGLGLNLEIGLNFQLHKRINIGYHITPITALVFWHENYLENPILTIKQRTETSTNFDANFFDSILGVRNFHISYVF